MLLPVHGISELALEVENMTRAVEFWSGTLGFPVVEQWGYADGQFTTATEGTEVWATWVYVGGNTRLGLWRPRPFTDDELTQKNQPVSSWPNTKLFDEGGEHVHFALSVDLDAFDTARDVLQRADVPITVRTYPDSPHRSLYFTDPEGNVVELYTLSMEQTYHRE